MPKITYVIGFRDNKYLSGRRYHLMATIENLRMQDEKDIEIIVIEESSKRIVEDIDGVDKQLWVHSDKPYCRSRIANIGLLEATTPYLVMHDGDVLMPPDYTTRLLHHLDKGSKVLHTGKYAAALYSWETRRVFQVKDKYNYAVSILNTRGPRKEAWDKPFTGYSIAMNIKAVKDIGGWYEGFIGWGYEDSSFIGKCKRLEIYDNPMESYMVHLEHPRSDIVPTNKALYEAEQNMSIDVLLAVHRQSFEKEYANYGKVQGQA